MTVPICPVCGDPLAYDEQLETYYDDDSVSLRWRGHCPYCRTTYTWWENYNLISITDMELDELE